MVCLRELTRAANSANYILRVIRAGQNPPFSLDAFPTSQTSPCDVRDHHGFHGLFEAFVFPGCRFGLLQRKGNNGDRVETVPTAPRHGLRRSVLQKLRRRLSLPELYLTSAGVVWYRFGSGIRREANRTATLPSHPPMKTDILEMPEGRTRGRPAFEEPRMKQGLTQMKDFRIRIGFYGTNPSVGAQSQSRKLRNEPILDAPSHERNRNTDVNCMNLDVYDRITKRTHALGAPVQGSKFNVQSLRNEPILPSPLLFKLHNYQTKPMLDTPNIYPRNTRVPRLEPGSGFLRNEPI